MVSKMRHRDAAHGSFSTSLSVHLSNGIVVPTGPPLGSNIQCHVLSPSGKYTFVALKLPKKKENILVLQLLDAFGGIRCSIDVEAAHGDLMTDSFFARISFNDSEDMVAYVADIVAEKGKSFDETFDEVEDWGEQYEGRRLPQVFVADFSEGVIIPIPLPEDALAAGQPCFRPNALIPSLVFVAWVPTWLGKARRLGSVYCFQRPCFLGLVSIMRKDEARVPSATLVLTNKDKLLVRSPRFTLDGRNLICLTADRPKEVHNFGTFLTVVDTKGAGVLGRLDRVPLYTPTIPDRPFIWNKNAVWNGDSCDVVVTSLSKTNVEVLRIDLNCLLSGSEGPVVNPLGDPHRTTNAEILDVCPTTGTVLVAIDTPNCSPRMELWPAAPDPTTANDAHCPTPVTVGREVDHSPSIGWWNVHDQDHGTSAAFVFPRKFGRKVTPILFPHGGPHSCFSSAFNLGVAFLVKSGFMVCMMNYRGSTGHGEEVLNALPGNIGDMDVRDCWDLYRRCLKEAHLVVDVDESKVLLLGGSHGGFLAAHMSRSSSPGFPPGVMVKGVALRNPVCDLAEQLVRTDIPDWCFTESGADPKSQIIGGEADVEARVLMMRKSPAYFLSEVTSVPLLMLLGKCDRRVPPEVGRNYARRLEAAGGNVKVVVYPNDNHSLSNADCDANMWVEIMTFFKEVE